MLYQKIVQSAGSKTQTFWGEGLGWSLEETDANSRGKAAKPIRTSQGTSRTQDLKEKRGGNAEQEESRRKNDSKLLKK